MPTRDDNYQQAPGLVWQRLFRLRTVRDSLGKCVCATRCRALGGREGEGLARGSDLRFRRLCVIVGLAWPYRTFQFAEALHTHACRQMVGSTNGWGAQSPPNATSNASGFHCSRSGCSAGTLSV
jgi:hypothetical protein